MYRALLGAQFDALPEAVRAVHSGEASTMLTGRCDVERGASRLSALIGLVAGLPKAGRDVPLRVRIERDAARECWTREFAGRPMRSVLCAREGVLEERLGPGTFRFALERFPGGLRWRLVGARILGVPMPLAWFAGVEARESAEDGAYRFDVCARLPVAGLLVRYRGALERDG